ncbi:MAG: 5,6-dimethylbenzimidazole synthase [Chloroflexota bacterium]
MNAFPESERAAMYRAIASRRDIRRFLPDPVSDALLWQLLEAAHRGPSVGFMQPWNFIVVRDTAVKAQVKALFERERQAAACFFDEPTRSQYLSLKLEGIMEAPVNLCVTCDPTRAGIVLGRNSQPETDVYSTCCAIENLWLAARAEGVGVGWVSILKLPQLRHILNIPPYVVPVAYLCIGYPEAFPDEPMLQTESWRDRLPLEDLVFRDTWGR